MTLSDIELLLIALTVVEKIGQALIVPAFAFAVVSLSGAAALRLCRRG